MSVLIFSADPCEFPLLAILTEELCNEIEGQGGEDSRKVVYKVE